MVQILQLQTMLRDIHPVHLVAILLGVYIFIKLATYITNGLLRWIPVYFGTLHIPVAPGSNFLLGHVFQLARGCAWEKMYEWVSNSPPLVRFRIFTRTGVIVGDPQGLKRIFQVYLFIFPCSNHN